MKANKPKGRPVKGNAGSKYATPLRVLLDKAKPYCDLEGRVIRLMPEALAMELRGRNRMKGLEFGRKCQYLGTKAWWFVIFDQKKQKDIIRLWDERYRELKAKREAQK